MTNTIKLFQLLESIMSEVGENTAEPYPTQRHAEHEDDIDYSIEYAFNADEGVDYTLSITKDTDEETSNHIEYSIDFGITDSEGWTDYEVTSKSGRVGNMRRVMATVIQAIKQELEIDTKSGRPVSTIWMQPSKEGKFDERRAKVYQEYIKKNMPSGAKVTYNSKRNFIKIDLPTNKQ